MDEDLSKLVKTKIKKNSLDKKYPFIKDVEMSYLIKIEEAINEIVKRKKKQWKEYTNIKVNQKAICSETRITKPTMNKYDILNEYIQCSTEEFRKIDIKDKLEFLSDKIRYLKKENSELILRDIKIMEIKSEYQKNEQLIEDLILQNKNYMTQAYELEQEKNMLNSELARYKVREVKFGGNKT